MTLSPEPMGPSSKLQGVMLGPNLCDQTVNQDIDAKTLYYSPYSPSIYLKHKKD